MATNKKKTEPAADVEQQTAETPETLKNDEKQGLSLADVQAAIAKMLAEAQAQADAIVADAEKRVKAYITDDEADKRAKEQAKKENLAWGEETVRVKLFQDGDKYKDDRFVSCNGETCLIKRGVWVEVKRKFVEILDNSEYQDARTNEMIAKLDGKSEKLADL